MYLLRSVGLKALTFQVTSRSLRTASVTSPESQCFLLQVSLVASMHSKQHTRVLGERVLKVARNLTNLLFSVLTRN